MKHVRTADINANRTQTARSCERGQAMVEFVIILIFIMAMCVGMLASMRLLTFQFWAQQEARYIAFEQTWAAHDFYPTPSIDPITKLDNGGFFGRPDIVTNRDKVKTVNDDQGLSELLSWLAPAATTKINDDSESIGEMDSSPVMLAKNESFWNRKATPWFAPGGSVDQALSFVSDAVATQAVTRSIKSSGFSPDETPQNPEDHPKTGNYQDRLAPKLKNFFHHAGVGNGVCEEFRDFAVRHDHPAFMQPFAGADCAEKIENGLANEIAYNLDIRDFFHGYEENIQNGFSPSQGLQLSVHEAVATGFYSNFDSLVTGSRALAIPTLVTGRIDGFNGVTGADAQRLISDLRYIGSAAAILFIDSAAGQIIASDPSVQNGVTAKSAEDAITQIIHEDADDALYFLSPVFLPVPPTFGAVAGGLQESVMKNLLSQSEDSDIRDEQIENANKTVEVTYKAAGGLFSAAERIKSAENAQLTARFYLVTQEWHQTRRENKTGAYRQKGNQFDPKSDETEEAVLRRRTLGLWLFPSDPAALIEPISLLPGLGFLAPIFQAFEPIGSVISFIKGFVTDNPLFDIAQALSEIPVIGDLVPVPPVWPAVRPDAYPGSIEMKGNEMDKPDKLMKDDRNFSDYVTEQRDNNPDANPKFN